MTAVSVSRLRETASAEVTPVTENAWLGITEFALMGDLNISSCPTCLKEIPDNFFMFRPSGLEFWRCLACLARTAHGGALFLTRSGDGGAVCDDDPAPY